MKQYVKCMSNNESSTSIEVPVLFIYYKHSIALLSHDKCSQTRFNKHLYYAITCIMWPRS